MNTAENIHKHIGCIVIKGKVRIYLKRLWIFLWRKVILLDNSLCHVPFLRIIDIILGKIHDQATMLNFSSTKKKFESVRSIHENPRVMLPQLCKGACTFFHVYFVSPQWFVHSNELQDSGDAVLCELFSLTRL